ncbi:MAG: mobility-associated LCxxNW protein, partial [Blautia producta]|nr:mobility-associated LCxxNW protein [Blautia producta]MDU5385379.1 mobility-associated LCxxNW protein [Blautia producta]MDU6885747.1 mobility-associated LCxxNW protein [Blautia producta]
MEKTRVLGNPQEYLALTDYELTRYELREAEGLCHGNWTEIQRLRRYIPA